MKPSFLQKCLRYLIPPHCGGCGELLDPADPEDLCKDCLAEWEQLTREACPCCHKTAAYCSCQVPAFSELTNVTHLSLLFYKHYDPNRLGDRMLYQAKRKENAHCYHVFSTYLSEKLLTYAAEHCISLSDYVVLYPPRTEENRRKYGFDHAARLAREIAKRCGMKCCSLFCREGGKEQKLSTATERRENAEETIF